ncbi:hypothetical protein DYB32_006023 [Aphanomyces invadans]|uniref:Uncharacterized protein n=1 Tax=Aphanomyces invadans TaxID=157072 RepID=A0A3R6Y6Z7_9STRA|nr:hypothetical protein DYB32_006023 [Aphanomyces invadans]
MPPPPPGSAPPHKHVYQFVAVNVVLPVAIYYIAQVFTSDDALALALSAIPPGLEALVQMVVYETVDPLSQIVSIVVAIVFMCITNDAKVLFVKDSLTTALCGATLIASTRWKQNVVLRYYYMVGVHDDGRDVPPAITQVSAHICRVWGGLFIFEALVRVGFIYSCSTSVMVIVSPCLALICSAAGIMWARTSFAKLSSPTEERAPQVHCEPYSPPPVKLA